MSEILDDMFDEWLRLEAAEKVEDSEEEEER